MLWFRKKRRMSMNESKHEKHATWLAVRQIVADEVAQQGARTTREVLATINLKVELLRDSEKFVEDTEAFDACSNASGLVGSALQQERDLEWLKEQVELNVARAAEESI
jgi:hypothetical protein